MIKLAKTMKYDYFKYLPNEKYYKLAVSTFDNAKKKVFNFM